MENLDVKKTMQELSLFIEIHKNGTSQMQEDLLIKAIAAFQKIEHNWNENKAINNLEHKSFEKLTKEDKKNYSKTLIDFLNTLASNGDQQALLKLINVIVVTQNKSQAIINKVASLCDKVDKDSLLAQHYICVLKVDGFFKGQREKGLQEMLSNAQKGFAPSYCFLAECYEESDFGKSVIYYEKAMELGEAVAATMLGHLHLKKMLPISPNPDKEIEIAIEYLKKAVDMGDAQGAYLLGVIFYENLRTDSGTFKTEDYEQAIKYLLIAKEYNPLSYILLGHIYFKLVFDVNLINHKMNMYYANMTREQLDDFRKKNISIFLKDTNLTKIDYNNHPGISIHTQYALHYLLMGVNSNIIPCFYYLGYMYYFGVPGRLVENKVEGLNLLQIAADSGHEESKFLLSKLEKYDKL